ncbi:cytochrome b [Candidatus Mesenet endosymbiont of Agriotes lineatus]|uniref:cytochrome b n=1 Tax=Candidatus Mesenet endosymbiont of Agriotes lineatus TaxID=3077948 RepID=UPI0030D58D5C
MKNEKYHLILRVVHWLMAVIILTMLISGFYMKSLPVDNPIKFSIYGIHKATGVSVFILVILRIILRLFLHVPPLPQNFSQVTVLITKTVHFALYVLMILIPSSGYIMSSASGRGIKYFFNFNVPLVIAENKMIAELSSQLHFISACLLIGFIALHLLGTIKHLIIDKQNILRRIV